MIDKKCKTQKERLEFVNSNDAHRMTALHYAAKYGRIEVVRVLLNNGANPLLPGDVDECLPVKMNNLPLLL